MDGLNPLAWRDMFITVATSAAALLGLVLVAVSLHAEQVEGHPILRNRARVALLALGAILIVALAGLIPDINAFWYGATAVVVNLGYVGLLAWSLATAYRGAQGLPRYVLLRATPNLLALVSAAGGISLMVGKGPGLYLLAPSMIVVLPVILFNVWSLLFASELHESKPVPH
ncbi:MAG: hypothetical protein ABI455_11165 [Candidatus Dormiibacterota bacterium]